MAINLTILFDSNLCQSTDCHFARPSSVELLVARIFGVLSVTDILMVYTFVYIKSRLDCFEGVSKLDNLVIISLFQRSNAPKPKDSVNTDALESFYKRHNLTQEAIQNLMENLSIPNCSANEIETEYASRLNQSIKSSAMLFEYND